MAENRMAAHGDGQPFIPLQLQSLTQPEIQSYISKLKTRYKRYAMSLEEGRGVIDQAMGDRTLSEILFRIRQETA